MRVARRGRPDIAGALIDAGANPNYRGKDGASALTIAAAYGNTGVVRIPLAKGAELNLQDDHGNTALMYAAEYGRSSVVKSAGAQE